MSMPQFPDADIDVSLTRYQTINLLLASIAYEELGLAHLINSEAEKIQYILGTLHEGVKPPTTLEGILKLNASVQQTLKEIIKTQMMLEFKMEEAIALTKTEVPPPDCFLCAQPVQ